MISSIFYKSYLTAIVFTITVAVLCFMPGNNLPNAPFLNFDKLVHVGIFSVLAFFWMYPNSVHKSNWWLTVSAFFLVLYGILIELIQHFFIYGRSGDFWDALADAVGVIIVFLLFLLKKRFTK